MSEIFFGASLIVAFLAGVIALFAPCCISFMFPSYFAHTFKQKSRLVLMTFIFALGVATIFLPLGLGLSFLVQQITEYHQLLYVIGGVFMIFLGYLSFQGKSLSLPIKIGKVDFKNSNALSIYSLGLFSGVATTCCAPVLFGALTVTALAPSLFQAFFISLAYVFGIVFPLFLMALFYDALNLKENKLIQGKILHFNFFNAKFEIHSSNLIAGVMFLLMGFISILGSSYSGMQVTEQQIQTKILITTVNDFVLSLVKPVPDIVLILVFIVIFLFFIWRAKKGG